MRSLWPASGPVAARRVVATEPGRIRLGSAARKDSRRKARRHCDHRSEGNHHRLAAIAEAAAAAVDEPLTGKVWIVEDRLLRIPADGGPSRLESRGDQQARGCTQVDSATWNGSRPWYYPTPMNNVRSLIEDFANQLTALVESQALDQARAAVESALGVRRPGRPAKISSIAAGKKTRKKLPKQFCPVPGCKNPAAPVFGMVCADHKNVAKTKIKKYREARKAKKLGIRPARAVKRATAAKPVAKRRRKKVARLAPVTAAKLRQRRSHGVIRDRLIASPGRGSHKK